MNSASGSKKMMAAIAVMVFEMLMTFPYLLLYFSSFRQCSTDQFDIFCGQQVSNATPLLVILGILNIVVIVWLLSLLLRGLKNPSLLRKHLIKLWVIALILAGELAYTSFQGFGSSLNGGGTVGFNLAGLQQLWPFVVTLIPLGLLLSSRHKPR